MKQDNILYRIKQGIEDTCYIWAKEMRSVFSDEGVLIFCIIVPLLYPLLYSWIYNNEVVRKVPVAIVDYSHSAASREFIRDLNASPDVKVAYYCNSLDEAKILTGKQLVHGTILFPENYEKNINRGEQAHVSVYTDMSLMLTYKAIFLAAQSVASKLSKDIQIAHSGKYTDYDEEVATQPIDYDEVPIFNTTGGYGNAILPAVLMLILQQTLLLGIGLAAGTARENNRYHELVPLSKHYNGIFRIVFGKAMCYFMIYMVMSAYLALVIPHIFHFVSMPSAITLIGLLVPYILACIFFGMIVSCLVRYRENVMLIVVFTSVIFLFMTGASWPQSNIPGFWQGVSWLIPSTFGVRGFLAISSMGATLSDIQTEYQALWIQTFVYFIITCIVYRQQLITTHKRASKYLLKLREKAKKAQLEKQP